jgi:hypothetical protein
MYFNPVTQVVALTNADRGLVATLELIGELPKQLLYSSNVSMMLFDKGKSPESCYPAAMNLYFVWELEGADTLQELADMYKQLVLTGANEIMTWNVLLQMLRIARQQHESTAVSAPENAPD